MMQLAEVPEAAAVFYPELKPLKPDYEIIEGVKTYMSPSPGWEHGETNSTLVMIFKMYCRKNDCGKVFGDNMDIHLPDEKNVLKPDLSVFKDRSLFKHDKNIYGVPDLVAEILSPSTANRDFGIKKDIYERNGVKEYWIVNHKDKSIHVFHLIDGKYKRDYIYHDFSADELEALDDDERAEIRKEIKVSVFDDLLVDIADIFYVLDEV